MAVKFMVHVNTPPGQCFFPGTEVSGEVSVMANRPKNFNSIEVSLFGNGYVSFETYELSEVSTLLSDEKYVSRNQVLWKREDSSIPSHKLPSGEHKFSFSLRLPYGIPPSFRDKRGCVLYFVEARINTCGLKRDYIARQAIRVAGIVDVNCCPRLQLPIHREKSVTYRSFSCASSAINVHVGLPRQGYCIGETVPASIMVENGSNRQVSVEATLTRTVTYSTEGFFYQSRTDLASSSTIVPKRTSTPWCPGNLKIPFSEPGVLLHSKIIKICYTIEVETSVKFSLKCLCVKVPLTVGNVALRPAVNPDTQWLPDPPPSYEEALREPAMYADAS